MYICLYHLSPKFLLLWNNANNFIEIKPLTNIPEMVNTPGNFLLLSIEDIFLILMKKIINVKIYFH